MRTTQYFNDGWYFLREDAGADATLSLGSPVTLPHTWNAVDGQDGGNDYYRGTCWYAKRFDWPMPIDPSCEVWLEFEGAAMTCEVFLNGTPLMTHAGGYSTFRVKLTPYLEEHNILAVSVDNSYRRTVYPQKADFTFYGGIYRDVKLITVPSAHFDLAHYGGQGIKVTPSLSDDLKSASVEIETWAVGGANTVTITAAGMEKTVPVIDGYAKVSFAIENVRLWDGVADPFLYTASATLDSGDKVETPFGCRTFSFDPDRGFFLNGRSYPLCGVSRHQDRWQFGNAITKEMHEEDMDLIRELGANTIRLAHYQHAQYFYDLCDKYGMILWAEIPYITEHMPEARENTISQMTELVVQNYNHPSIICWGLSNEITAAGGVNPDMVENHHILNDLCHRLDSTRPTTMAHAFMLDMDDPFVMLPDIRSYNLYYGWYLAEKEDNDKWFDDFHTKYPNAIIGLSEYGADANPAYQNPAPEKGDWTESYQAAYHEHMLKMWKERPYIWSMHVWNMFDFAADGRNEGGKHGQNQKGLVTFDRKTKKDAFYIYKAYLSDVPFVHLCGSRYINRHEDETEIKVYSNLDEITLYMDGKEIGRRTGNKVFKFRVPISGSHCFKACSGQYSDEMTICKVNERDRNYIKDGSEIVNWFDRPDEMKKEGFYSIFDTMADIKKNPESAALLAAIMAETRKSYGDVARSVTMPASVQSILDRSPLEKVLKQAGKAVTPAMVKELNYKLNQIPKS